MKPTEKILEQGKALVRAIESLETIEPTGLIEQVIPGLPPEACGHGGRETLDEL